MKVPRKPGTVWEELLAGAALSGGEQGVLARLFSVQQRALLRPGYPSPPSPGRIIVWDQNNFCSVSLRKK